MFPKTSAFDSSSQEDHLEHIRAKSLETPVRHLDKEKSNTERLAAYDMLKAAERFIDDEEYAEAGELVRRAAELLDANPMSTD